MAVPKRKYDELIERYNSISGQPDNTFPMRRLCKDAETEYRLRDDLVAGHIWAAALFELNKINESLCLHEELAQRIPPDAESELSVSLYLSYARLYFCQLNLAEALSKLDSVYDALHTLPWPNKATALNIYAAAAYKDAYYKERLLQLLKQGYKPEENPLPGFPLIVYHLADNSLLLALNYATMFAKNRGIDRLSLDTLDDFMSRFEIYLIKPPYKLALTVEEKEILQELKQTLLEIFQMTHELINDGMPQEEAGRSAAATLSVSRRNAEAFRELAHL